MEVLDNQNTQKKSEIYKVWFNYIWFPILVFAIICEAMNWPGQAAIFMLASSTITGYNLAGLRSRYTRNNLNKTLSILGLLYFLYLLWGMVFNYGFPLNYKGVILQLVIIGIAFGIGE